MSVHKTAVPEHETTLEIITTLAVVLLIAGGFWLFFTGHRAESCGAVASWWAAYCLWQWYRAHETTLSNGELAFRCIISFVGAIGGGLVVVKFLYWNPFTERLPLALIGVGCGLLVVGVGVPFCLAVCDE